MFASKRFKNIHIDQKHLLMVAKNIFGLQVWRKPYLHPLAFEGKIIHPENEERQLLWFWFNPSCSQCKWEFWVF